MKIGYLSMQFDILVAKITLLFVYTILFYCLERTNAIQVIEDISLL